MTLGNFGFKAYHPPGTCTTSLRKKKHVKTPVEGHLMNADSLCEQVIKVKIKLGNHEPWKSYQTSHPIHCHAPEIGLSVNLL